MTEDPEDWDEEAEWNDEEEDWDEELQKPPKPIIQSNINHGATTKQ